MSRILIVEDEHDSLYYLRTLLEGHGFSVDSARNGADALERARNLPPDVVISDLLMPRMDGFALLRTWKADPVLGRVPFVVYTATYVEPEDEALALELGADAFILKPAEPDAFLESIRKVLAAEPRVAVRAPRIGSAEDRELLERHTETLIRKLDQRTIELEATNARLRADIRRREAVETSLREREAHLRLAGTVARLGGWSYDAVKERLWWSEQVFAIHELEPGPTPTLEEAIGYYAPEFRDAMRRHVQLCLDGTPFDDELELVTARGRRIWVRAIGHPDRSPEGRIVRIHGALQDVDDRRKLEMQYRHAQKMEVVGRLAGGVAHDFNNLLTIINGYADLLLKRTELDDEARDIVETILKAGERSAGLTQQLLVFSRQEVATPRVVDLNDAVAHLETMLKRVLGTDLTLITHLAPDLGKVKLDRGQLEQVLLNLAVNARDAMPHGGTLTIETRNEESAGGRRVTLAVRDSGCGMPASVRERLFEPFFTTKPAGQGTGLGLSVVHGIVEQHGGHIEVASEVGAGTTITIHWPRVDEATVADEPAAAEGTRGGTETILLVEDDDLVRAFTRSALARYGYRVLEASTPDVATELATSLPGPIDVLVTDVVMPGMGGRQLAEELVARRPQLKVLFISGHTHDAALRQGILNRDVHFIQKPFSTAGLARKVREVLDA